mmetsp:Transcript_16874/g.41097  ORF Transcript_16874/g.41097 Transcript_16874/m.41097 type:complete len:98 (+) Transcript_16874:248-541(+)
MKSTTIGEELFLVHLRRNERSQETAGEEEHGDTPAELKEGRKRASSIGEELWQVHLKRSRGDEDHDVASAHIPDENHKDTNNTTVGRYNLRSRTPKK